MRAHRGLDGVGQRARRGTAAATVCGQEDEASVTPAIREPLRRERTEVLDVVGHHRPLLARCRVEDIAVGCLHQVRALGDSLDVQATPPQDSRYQGRELLVEQRLHVASARLPASQAA